MLDKIFQLKAHGTTARTETIAGITTFLTMAYIIFVNPNVLAKAGMDHGAVFVATCLAAAIGCFIMGFLANLPVALAPGMGLNAFFTYTVVLQLGHSWQTALACVFLSGVLFILISLFRIREWLINAIPNSLKKAIAAGIGGFLAFIALQSAGIIVDADGVLVKMGSIISFAPLMTALCLLLIIAFIHYRVPGSVMLAILIVSALGVLFHNQPLPPSLIATPPSLAPTFMQMDFRSALDPAMYSIIFAFFFVDLFDTAGTLIGVTERGGLVRDGKIPNLKKALLADSSATGIGAVPDGSGWFYPATVLDHVNPNCRVYREEVFGPVAMLLRAKDATHAVELANDSPFGLGACIYTADTAKAWRFAEKIHAGSVFINRHTSSDLRLPFGGVKDSGYGRELSEFGLYEFVNVKTYWQK